MPPNNDQGPRADGQKRSESFHCAVSHPIALFPVIISLCMQYKKYLAAGGRVLFVISHHVKQPTVCILYFAVY